MVPRTCGHPGPLNVRRMVPEVAVSQSWGCGDGGMQGWRNRGMEEQREVGMEGCRVAEMWGWRNGGICGWRDAGMKKCGDTESPAMGL